MVGCCCRDDGRMLYAKPLQGKLRKLQEASIVQRSNGRKVAIDENKKAVTFLDVTIDLTSTNCKPYIKTFTTNYFVYRQSNYTPALLKNIPKTSTNGPLAFHPAKKSLIFDEAITSYPKAFKKSGYLYNLHVTYKPENKKRKATGKSNISL